MNGVKTSVVSRAGSLILRCHQMKRVRDKQEYHPASTIARFIKIRSGAPVIRSKYNSASVIGCGGTLPVITISTQMPVAGTCRGGLNRNYLKRITLRLVPTCMRVTNRAQGWCFATLCYHIVFITEAFVLFRHVSFDSLHEISCRVQAGIMIIMDI